MFRLIYLICALLLSGCATMQPMSSQSISDLKKGNSVIAFYDGVEQINFLEDKYMVLAVARVASSSDYQGFWDSNKEISAYHTAELSKIGVRGQSLYDVLTESERLEFIEMQREMYTHLAPSAKISTDSSHDNKDLSTLLNAKFRERLLEKGYDHLIWISWSGYLLHIHTLGLPPHEEFQTTYWIHDLKRNSTVWNGEITFIEKVEFEGDSGKSFLEKNQLAGLKGEVERMIKERYKIRTGRGIYNDSIGQIIGLEAKN